MPVRPLPIADHALPFHLATRFRTRVPSCVKLPDAMTSPLATVLRNDTSLMPLVQIGAHELPSKRARSWKTPPKYQAPLARMSPLPATAMARTAWYEPEPTGDQPAPSQTARLLATPLPATVKFPPTKTRPLGNAARWVTRVLVWPN